MDDYYEILGINPNAPVDDVRAAWRELSKRLHPDRGGSAALFRLAHTAYTVLSDPQKRAAYDAGDCVAEEPLDETPWMDFPWDRSNLAEGRSRDEGGSRRRPKRLALTGFAVFMILLVLVIAVPLFVPNAPAGVSSELGLTARSCT